MAAVDSPWPSWPARLALSKNDVHVWFAAVDQAASHAGRLARLLSVDEQMRAERYCFGRDRRRFIVRRGILRSIVGDYLGIEPEKIMFRYGCRGKPAVVKASGEDTLCFNLSHSQGLAVYAMTRSRQIGIDLECVRPLSEVERLVECNFSEHEKAAFRALPTRDRLRGFFNCWTRKEAYLKALGEGLARPLDEFAVSLAPGETARLLKNERDPVEVRRWSFRQLEPAPGYLAALVVEGQGWDLACRKWRHNDSE